jgi:hypothetical protein
MILEREWYNGPENVRIYMLLVPVFSRHAYAPYFCRSMEKNRIFRRDMVSTNEEAPPTEYDVVHHSPRTMIELTWKMSHFNYQFYAYYIDTCKSVISRRLFTIINFYPCTWCDVAVNASATYCDQLFWNVVASWAWDRVFSRDEWTLLERIDIYRDENES